jgi:release factor glutamine methyltransferase
MIEDAVSRGADALRAAGIRTARLDAELLLQHALGVNRTEFLTMEDRSLSPMEEDMYADLIERRGGREPLQYITGEAAFRHLILHVTPDVLVPRPETEWVAEEAIAAIKHLHEPSVLDVGTGSGAIAIAVATEVERAEVVATDISRAALTIAIGNAEAYGVTDRIQFLLSDYLSDLPQRLENHFHVIVSNPPYIARHELSGLEPEVRDHEPMVALSPGSDPLQPHRAIAAAAPRFLKPEGVLILEVGAGSGPEGKAILKASGLYKDVELLLDLAGQDRVIKAVLK